jgi:anthranilate phosphoribosyltransferase
MIREAISALVDGKDISPSQAAEVAREILDGAATPSQIASFATALRIRGETVGHIVAFAEVMREKSTRLKRPAGPVLDVVGTGGDKSGTFNISTIAAFVAAGAGAVVAKHGNRSATSKCGSADVLEALGVNIDASPETVQRCLDENGICFMFARTHHAAMRFAAAPRAEMGIRTIFNLLGPLTNPAAADRQLTGVFDGDLTETYAEALSRLGVERAMVVHGEDGLDELTTAAPTKISELRDGKIDTRKVSPEDFGMARANASGLLGGDAEANRGIALAVLQGKATQAQSDIVLLNAGAALCVAGKADTITGGIALATETIANGAALRKLEALKECSNSS